MAIYDIFEEFVVSGYWNERVDKEVSLDVLTPLVVGALIPEKMKDLQKLKKDREIPPIMLDLDEEGNYVLLDGRHRIMNAKASNQDTIKATVPVKHTELPCDIDVSVWKECAIRRFITKAFRCCPNYNKGVCDGGFWFCDEEDEIPEEDAMPSDLSSLKGLMNDYPALVVCQVVQARDYPWDVETLWIMQTNEEMSSSDFLLWVRNNCR